jgi:hypothetical protein
MAGPQIAFLHTAAVHVLTFDTLIHEQAPGLRVRHVVDESLLLDARANASSHASGHAELRQRVHQAMRAAADGGVHQVLCTCSTIGGLAESVATDGHFEAARIDRAMADRAAQRGPRVLLVAALASTVEPTRALLFDSAMRQRREVRIEVLLVDTAWALFEQGDRDGYLAAVATATRTRAAEADVVVLAQASMAGAVALLADLGIEVLASPVLGVARAVERWRSGAGGPAA